ncbi:MAG: CD1845 family protein [Peptoniphilus sp.]|nr:CD1845 family protein [Peptoniphilus sp.]MDD7362727.1 CD1845 family protein [Bacillota bacterium]MDY6044579.1 CD1845 family protein [Peptoniphilus sp.]
MCLGALTLVLSIFLHIGKAILRLFMGLCVLVAVVFFLKNDPSTAISAAVVGFLLGPYGITLVGDAVVGCLRGINRAIGSI